MDMTAAPQIRIPGFPTKSFTWNPTVASRVVSAYQTGEIKGKGIKKIRWSIDAPTCTWRVQVAATPAGHATVAALVADTVAEYGFKNAHSLDAA